MGITIIIFANHGEKYAETLQNLTEIVTATPSAEIEVVVLDVQEQTAGADILNTKMSDQAYVKVCPVKSEKFGEVLRKAILESKYQYVSIAAAGTLYDSSFLLALKNIQPADAYIMMPSLSKPSSNSRFYEFYNKVTLKRDMLNLSFIPEVGSELCSAFIFNKDILKRCSIPEKLTAFWSVNYLMLSALDQCSVFPVLNDTYVNFGVQQDETEHYVRQYDGMKAFLSTLIKEYVKNFKEKQGYISALTNHMLMRYLLDWINFDSAVSWDDLSSKEYCEITDSLLENIDDTNLLKEKTWNMAQKVFWMERKYHKPVEQIRQCHNIFYLLDGKAIGEAAVHLPIVIQFIRIHSDYIEIEGIARCYSKQGEMEMYLVSDDGEQFLCSEDPYSADLTWQNQKVCRGFAFTGKVPLKAASSDITFVQKIDGYSVIKKKVIFAKYTPIYSSMKTSFYSASGWILTYDADKVSLHIEKETPQMQKECQRAYEKELWNAKGNASRKSLLFRKCLGILKKTIFHKKIWLISDRINRGDDNGEAFFEYLSKNKHRLKGRKVYFVLEKNSPDAKRIRKYGKLIEPMSKKHKMYHLISEYIISSQGNDPVVNPFKSNRVFYRDLLQNEKFVFLQHGITKDNQSQWLGKYNRNLYGFIVSTLPEYQSVFEYNYGYTKERVWLTGMPRFDRLYHDEKKYITIMPTWRKSLMSGMDPETSIWLLKDNFEQSAYFEFYNSLLNHEGLIQYLKEKGYRLCFMPHPIMAPYVKDYFQQNPEVIFWNADKSYREVFAETDLMVTDYSSVAFDFAYLRKPIIYSHFDREDFFSGSHSYTEGYFDYERDGFGEITLTIHETVEAIKKYVDHGCKAEEKYLERINRTFAFSDKNCCERVLEHLLESH